MKKGQNDWANLNFSICTAEAAHNYYQLLDPIKSIPHLQFSSTRGQRVIKVFRQGKRFLQPSHGLLGSSVNFPLPILRDATV